MKPNFDFQERFGRVFYLIPDFGLKYEQNSSGKLFSISADTVDSELENLMRKSLAESKDYVFELVKNDEFKMDLEFVF